MALPIYVAPGQSEPRPLLWRRQGRAVCGKTSFDVYVFVCLYLCVCLCVSPRACLSLSKYISVCVSTCHSMCLSASVCSYICLALRLCLPLCLALLLYPSVRLSNSLSIPTPFPPHPHLSFRPSLSPTPPARALPASTHMDCIQRSPTASIDHGPQSFPRTLGFYIDRRRWRTPATGVMSD